MILWQSKQIRSPIRSGCVSITLSSPPKYRRKIIYNQYKTDPRDILKQLCSYKGVEILEGHYVSTVELNEAGIKKYIQDQERADIIQDKLSVKEYEDPFKGQV